MTAHTIAAERVRIDSYRFPLGPANFFGDRSHKEGWEWVVLSYLTEILRSVNWVAPDYAEKIAGESQPDFQTYLSLEPPMPYRRVEVTVVYPHDYRIGEHYSAINQKRSGSSSPDMHWAAFADVLRAKLGKPYASGSWLLIYHDIPPPELDCDLSVPWHEFILRKLRTWTMESSSSCDIRKSAYEAIFVVDCEGKAAVRLYPHWDVVKAAATK
jgi:hypothetical protein